MFFRPGGLQGYTSMSASFQADIALKDYRALSICSKWISRKYPESTARYADTFCDYYRHLLNAFERLLNSKRVFLSTFWISAFCSLEYIEFIWQRKPTGSVSTSSPIPVIGEDKGRLSLIIEEYWYLSTRSHRPAWIGFWNTYLKAWR